MLSRASKILTLVPKHNQSSNDEESSDSSSEVENFHFQKRDSTESSLGPSFLLLLKIFTYFLTMKTTSPCPKLLLPALQYQ